MDYKEIEIEGMKELLKENMSEIEKLKEEIKKLKEHIRRLSLQKASYKKIAKDSDWLLD